MSERPSSDPLPPLRDGEADGLAPRLSVVVITRNEATRIGACLASCALADEWIVLDSGSIDDTRELARAAGARVARSPDWPGFGPQKNRALDLARGRWVLSIDADEVVSPELSDEIAALLDRDPQADGYWIRRASAFRGRRIRFGDWRNDRVLRLFRRDRGRFSDDVVHERVLLAPAPDGGRAREATLEAWLWHDSVPSYAVGREKMLRYARLGAEKLRARGRGGMVSAVLHAFWTFVRGILIRQGFLDGWRGWQIAWLNTQGTFLRYLWAGRPASPAPAPTTAHPEPAQPGSDDRRRAQAQPPHPDRETS